MDAGCTPAQSVVGAHLLQHVHRYRFLTRGTPTADSVMCEGIVVIDGVTVLVAAIARVTDATDPAAERIMGGKYYVVKVFYDDEDRHSFAAV